MRVVSHKKLKEFYETKGRENACVALERWYHVALTMEKITKEQYKFALAKIEELLPMVDDHTPSNDKKALELSLMSEVVIAYEKVHHPIEKPTISELIELSLEENGITQKELAGNIGVSPSRVNDYIAGRSEPTLKIARLLCMELNISPAAMFRV